MLFCYDLVTLEKERERGKRVGRKGKVTPSRHFCYPKSKMVKNCTQMREPMRLLNMQSEGLEFSSFGKREKEGGRGTL
jgi:hypothetical protein